MQKYLLNELTTSGLRLLRHAVSARSPKVMPC
jgi:hypothetical protein